MVSDEAILALAFPLESLDVFLLLLLTNKPESILLYFCAMLFVRWFLLMHSKHSATP